jgi:hypothetical protein
MTHDPLPVLADRRLLPCLQGFSPSTGELAQDCGTRDRDGPGASPGVVVRLEPALVAT